MSKRTMWVIEFVLECVVLIVLCAGAALEVLRYPFILGMTAGMSVSSLIRLWMFRSIDRD